MVIFHGSEAYVGLFLNMLLSSVSNDDQSSERTELTSVPYNAPFFFSLLCFIFIFYLTFTMQVKFLLR